MLIRLSKEEQEFFIYKIVYTRCILIINNNSIKYIFTKREKKNKKKTC